MQSKGTVLGAAMILLSYSETLGKAPVTDDRVYVDRTAENNEKLDGIGFLTDAAGNFHGSTFKVGPCAFLAPTHSAMREEIAHDGILTRQKYIGRIIYIWVGQAQGGRRPMRDMMIPGTIFAYGEGYTQERIDTVQSDWVLIQAPLASTQKYSYLPFYPYDPELMSGLSASSYSIAMDRNRIGTTVSEHDGPLNLYGDLKCKIFGMERNAYLQDSCAATNGASGSPIVAACPNAEEFHKCAAGMVLGTIDADDDGLGRPLNYAHGRVALGAESGVAYGYPQTQGDIIRQRLAEMRCK